MSDAAAGPEHRSGWRRLAPYFLDDAQVAADAIYGLILVTAVIVAASFHSESLAAVFLFAAVSVLVFWCAHLYAVSLAAYARGHHTVGPAIRHAAREERGMVQATLLPLAILLLGVLGVLEERLAVWLALWAGVLVLALVPILALRRRGAPWSASLLGGLGSAALGLVMVLLKALIH